MGGKLLHPTPETSNETPVQHLRFPWDVRRKLNIAGLITVGNVRQTADEALLELKLGRSGGLHPRNAGLNCRSHRPDCRAGADQEVIAVPFTIEATSATGSVFLTCSTASETLNRVLELEQRPHGSIIVRDGNRRSIDIDELIATALCGIDLPARTEAIRRVVELGLQAKAKS